MQVVQATVYKQREDVKSTLESAAVMSEGIAQISASTKLSAAQLEEVLTMTRKLCKPLQQHCKSKS
jgi:hypothetical protein